MNASGELWVSAMGVVIKVTIGGIRPPELAQLHEQWAECLSGPSPEAIQLSAALARTSLDVVEPTEHDLVVASFPELCDRLTGLITRTAIQARAGSGIMLHASGLADPQHGTVAVFVGPSGAGKTTVARTLASRFSYVSDETIAIDDDLGITPYRKPLSVKVDSIESHGWKTQIGPTQAQALELPARPLELGALVFLDRAASSEMTTAPALNPLNTGEALKRLVEQASFLDRQTAPLTRLRRLIEATGGAMSVRYSQAETLGDLVTKLLAAVGTTPSPRPVRTLRRASDADALDIAGNIQVYARGRLYLLSDIGATVWRLCAIPTREDRLAGSIVRQYGPETAPGAVDKILDSLLAAGILDVGSTR